MAPCTESSSGWAVASPLRNYDLSGGRSSPFDFNPDIKSADAALQRISRAANGEGGAKYTRDDIVNCFERIHRATEHLVDGVEHERDELDVRSEPDLCSSHNREQRQDDLDLVAMINVSQDILRTLRYVQDSNSNSRRQQHYQERTNHHRRHSRNESQDRSPVSPRQNIARGQKRKREQEQQEAGRKKAYHAQPTYCRHCSCTGTVKWRTGPDGLKTLCNVCGLLYAKRLRRHHEMH